jgi:predicted alpha/beta-hydrolase family hydrolase
MGDCEYCDVAAAARVREIETPSGIAKAYIERSLVTPARGLAVLGHGAGGGVDAPDLAAVTSGLGAAGWTVARVEQPYRVKGRRAPEAAPRLDSAWLAVVAALRGRDRSPLLVGGRSSGARVACRTAGAVGAAGVVALAFPLHPPGKPEKSRIDELVGTGVPVIVIQGDRDPFGSGADVRRAAGRAGARLRTIVSVPGDHSLRQAAAAAAVSVVEWAAGIGS